SDSTAGSYARLSAMSMSGLRAPVLHGAGSGDAASVRPGPQLDEALATQMRRDVAQPLRPGRNAPFDTAGDEHELRSAKLQRTTIDHQRPNAADDDQQDVAFVVSVLANPAAGRPGQKVGVEIGAGHGPQRSVAGKVERGGLHTGRRRRTLREAQ